MTDNKPIYKTFLRNTMRQIFITNCLNARFIDVVLYVLLGSFSVFPQISATVDKKQKADLIFNEAMILVNEGTLGFIGIAGGKLEEARNLYHEIGFKQNEIYCLVELGRIYSNFGEKQKGLEYFNQVVILADDIGDKYGKAITLNNIGLIYSELGEKQIALDYFNKSLALRIEVKDKRGEAKTLTAIGTYYSDTGSFEKGISYLNQALRLSKEVDDKFQQTIILNLVGVAYLNSGNESKAIASYDQALEIAISLGDNYAKAMVLLNLGFANSILGDSIKASYYLNQALIFWRMVGDKRGEAVTLFDLMNVSNKLGNREIAAFYGKQAVGLYQQIRSNIRGLDKSIQQSYLKTIEITYRNLADILIAESRLPEAQAVLDLLKEEEFSGVALRGGEGAGNVPYSKAEYAALKILDQLAVLGREKRELANKNEKDSLTDGERQRFREVDKQISIAEAEFDKSLKQLSTETNKGQNFDVVVKDAQAFMGDLKQLGGGAVALYTVIVNDTKLANQTDQSKKELIKTGWIILVTPEFRKAYPIDVTDLEQTIFQFQTVLSSPKYNPQPLAEKLYKKLFLQTSEKQTTTLAADLDEYFKGKTDRTLMWSLDGVLRYIPFAALNDGKQYLVEKFRNTIFNTASKARLKDTVQAKWTVLGLGVSLERTESGKKFPALNGAKRELQTIVHQKDAKEGIMNGTIKLDEKFTSDAMFDALLFDKNPLVHIASHFSYQPADFNESFLLLGKGKLTVKDLSAKSNLFSNVDLLTLSACETAVGNANGKDVEGFAYLAQSLGAKAVMATLWQVDDVGTQVLMPEFYRLHETGLGKAEALRQAQLALLQGKIKDVPTDLKRAELVGTSDAKIFFEKYDGKGKPPFAHPYYWSPFVLIGNWK